MKKKLAAGMVSLALCLAISATWAHDHDHDHAAAAPVKLELNHGRKWPTDSALRQGMNRIRDAIGAGAQESPGKLADQVNAQIAYLVQNCKLDKETDAMLHLVLAELIAGADMLQGKPTEGFTRLNQALTAYGAYFEHPGWSPVK